MTSYRLHVKRSMQVLVNQILRRNFLVGLFVVSTLLCIFSCSLLSRAYLENTSKHQAIARSKQLHEATAYGEYDGSQATEGVYQNTRPRPGYYGDGYNFRKLPHEFFKLAPEPFDEIPRDFLPTYKNPCFFYRGPAPYSLRCLPYFYLIGMQKCGSTDLWEKISAHYEIQRTEKEPHWWARYRVRELPKDYHVNITTPLSLSWYLDTMSYNIVPRLVQTPVTSNWLVIGDGSTSTLWDNGWQTIQPDNKRGPTYTIANVMREIQPNAKFIVVLRNPTKRTYSDYLFFGHERERGVSINRFHEIVSNGTSAYNDCLAKNFTERACTYIHGTDHARLLLGNYAVFLRDWLKVYPRDQILVLRLEDWEASCVKVLGQIFKFLDLSPFPRQKLKNICGEERKRVNSIMHKNIGPLLPQTKTLLDNFYRPMNKELSQLLNDTRFLW